MICFWVNWPFENALLTLFLRCRFFYFYMRLVMTTITTTTMPITTTTMPIATTTMPITTTTTMPITTTMMPMTTTTPTTTIQQRYNNNNNNDKVATSDVPLLCLFSFLLDSDFAPKCSRRRKSSSGSEGLHFSPIRDKVTKNGDFVVVYVAVDFKTRKPGSHSAGISIYWGDTHQCNDTVPLRGEKLTQASAQLVG